MAGTDQRRDSQDYRRFDVGDRSPTLAVLESVATVKGVDPLSLPPLGSHTDSDALDQLLASASDASVRFRYAGVTIEITSSGEITVTDRRG